MPYWMSWHVCIWFWVCCDFCVTADVLAASQCLWMLNQSYLWKPGSVWQERLALFTPLLRVCFSSSQDYHWQWRSFLTSGFTAVYFLVYAIHYFFSKLQITGLASTILYFGYTMIMALIFFLFTGRYRKKKGGMRVGVFFHSGHSFSCTRLAVLTLRLG